MTTSGAGFPPHLQVGVIAHGQPGREGLRETKKRGGRNTMTGTREKTTTKTVVVNGTR